MDEDGQRAVRAVLVDERERRRADLRRIGAQALREAAHEDRLAAPEIPRDEDDVAGAQLTCERSARGTRLLLAPREDDPLQRGLAPRGALGAAPRTPHCIAVFVAPSARPRIW